MELKNSCKKLTLEKEAIKQRMASTENEVTSLQEEMNIDTSLKEELTSKRKETLASQGKRGLLMSVKQSLKAPHLDRSTKGDSSLKRNLMFNHLPLHLYFIILEIMGHISIMCNTKEAITNRICRWVPKVKKNEAQIIETTYQRVNVFQVAKRKLVTKGLKVSPTTMMKKGERKVVSKQRMDSTKIRDHPSSFMKSSSKCQHKENGSKMNGYKMQKKIKTKDTTRADV